MRFTPKGTVRTHWERSRIWLFAFLAWSDVTDSFPQPLYMRICLISQPLTDGVLQDARTGYCSETGSYQLTQRLADVILMTTCSKCGIEYSGNYCKPCRNIYLKEYRLRNLSKSRELQRQYTKEYRERNPEKSIESTRQSQKRFRERNPESVKAHRMKWVLNNKDTYCAMRASIKANRRERERTGRLSTERIVNLIGLQKNKCACCKIDLSNSRFHVDHIVPLAKGGKNVDSNVQLLCPSCNHKKSDKDPIDFMQSRGYLL